MRLGTIYRYELLKNLNLFSKIKENESILDIGGYDGFTLSNLNSKNKFLIDPDAKKIFSSITYLKEDFFNYDFKMQRFDYIFSFDVLEHIPKKKEEEFFKKIKKLLRIKGRVFITIPSKQIKVFPKFLTGWVSKKWDHKKCRGYSKEELKFFIEKIGLKYEIRDLNAKNYLRFYLILKSLEKILPKKIIYKLIKKIAKKDSIKMQGNEGYYLLEAWK